jgi:hypothetical protein
MEGRTFRLPGEDRITITDGTSRGFPVPARLWDATAAKAAE